MGSSEPNYDQTVKLQQAISKLEGKNASKGVAGKKTSKQTIPTPKPIPQTDARREQRNSALAKAREAKAAKRKTLKESKATENMPIAEAPDNPISEHMPKRYKVESAESMSKAEGIEKADVVAQTQFDASQTQVIVQSHLDAYNRVAQEQFTSLRASINELSEKLVSVSSAASGPTLPSAAPVHNRPMGGKFLW